MSVSPRARVSAILPTPHARYAVHPSRRAQPSSTAGGTTPPPAALPLVQYPPSYGQHALPFSTPDGKAVTVKYESIRACSCDLVQ